MREWCACCPPVETGGYKMLDAIEGYCTFSIEAGRKDLGERCVSGARSVVVVQKVLNLVFRCETPK